MTSTKGVIGQHIPVAGQPQLIDQLLTKIKKEDFVKNKLLLTLIIPLLFLLFPGCQNPATEAQDTSDDPVKNVFLGGSLLVDPEQPDINQLLPGMQLPIRMAKYKKDSDGSPSLIADSVKYGRLTIQKVDYAFLVFTLTVRNSAHTVIINNVTVELAAGSLYDIDNDGYYDIAYQKSDRAGALKTMYLTFISSQTDNYTTMYQLLPEYFPSGYYPSGLAGITLSGHFIIMQSDNTAQDTFSPALTSLLKEGDIIINPAASENDSIVKEISAITGASPNITYSYITGADSEVIKKAFELCYVEAHGLASQLDDSKAAARDTTFHVFDIPTQSISIIAGLKDNPITFKGSFGGKLDFRVNLSIDLFFQVEFHLTAVAIFTPILAGEMAVAKTEKIEILKSICSPSIIIPIAQVPVKLTCAIGLGMDIESKAKASITISGKAETQIGFDNFHVKAWMELLSFTPGPRLNIDPPKPVFSISPKITSLETYIGGELKVFLYIWITPKIEPALVSHINFPIKTGFEFKFTKDLRTQDEPTVNGELNYLTKFGIITGSVGINGFELDLGKIDLGIESRIPLKKFVIPLAPAEPTAVPTAAPTAVPTALPTSVPTAVPTDVPTPTPTPTTVPTPTPTPVWIEFFPSYTNISYTPGTGTYSDNSAVVSSYGTSGSSTITFSMSGGSRYRVTFDYYATNQSTGSFTCPGGTVSIANSTSSSAVFEWTSGNCSLYGSGLGSVNLVKLHFYR